MNKVEDILILELSKQIAYEINKEIIKSLRNVEKLPALRELIENGNHFYDKVLDYEIEGCKRTDTDVDKLWGNYIDNFNLEVERLIIIQNANK